MRNIKQKISITINEKTLKDIDSIIDHIYIRNRSQAIEHLVQSSLGESKTAIILSGGNEEKRKIKDEYRPTVMIKGETVVEKAIKKLKGGGFKKIFFVGRGNLLTRVFSIVKDGAMFGVSIEYVEEKDSKGTGDSLRLLKGRITSNFLVVYSDLIFDRINLEELWNSHLRQKSMATIMMTTSPNPKEKGTLKVEGNKVLKFVQKPRSSDIYLVFSPIFVAGPEIMEYSGHSLEEDIFPKIAKQGMLFGYLSSEKEIHIHSEKDLNEYCRHTIYHKG